MNHTRGLRPEGPFLSAQAAGLGIESRVRAPTLKGSFSRKIPGERAFQARRCTALDVPGLRPGLTEAALQAEFPWGLGSQAFGLGIESRVRAPTLKGSFF